MLLCLSSCSNLPEAGPMARPRGNLSGDPSEDFAEVGLIFGKLQKKAPYALKSLDAALKLPPGLRHPNATANSSGSPERRASDRHEQERIIGLVARAVGESSAERPRGNFPACNALKKYKMRSESRHRIKPAASPDASIPHRQCPALPQVRGAHQHAVFGARDRIGGPHRLAHDDLVAHRLEQADRVGRDAALDAQFVGI